MERRLARAVRATVGIRMNGRVARYVDHRGIPSFARGRSQSSQQGFCQSKRTQYIGLQGKFKIFAVRVRERRQRNRPEAGSIIDKHVEASQRSEDLHRNRISVSLLRYISRDAVRAWPLAGYALHSVSIASNERHSCSTVEQDPHQRKA